MDGDGGAVPRGMRRAKSPWAGGEGEERSGRGAGRSGEVGGLVLVVKL